MTRTSSRRRRRSLVAAASTLALVAAAAATTAGAAAQAEPQMTHHAVILGGLDNPRQLTLLENGDFLVAQAGHGSYNPDNCFGTGEGRICIGITGKVTRVHDGVGTDVMSRLLSAASPDGTFATGPDGAGRLPKGPYYAIMTGGSPDDVPPGFPGRQLGRLLMQEPGGPLEEAANISAFERRHDPDGEGVDSNPYSVLPLANKVLVADAAGDYIAKVKDGQVSVWAVLPEYGENTDAVPTSLARGVNGTILVGELHSEIPRKAHVWQYDRLGRRLNSWTGLTTVTGVAQAADGTLYVSELFGGTCTFDQIPTCFPGRVVKILPNGTRSHLSVPFPAGIVTVDGHVYVNAFSVSPAKGFGGNPEWAGQLWEIFP